MSKGRKDIPRSEVSDLKQQLRDSKQEIERLKRIVKRLNSELKTANTAFNESANFIDEKLAEMPVDSIVKYFSTNSEKKLKSLQEDHRKTLEDLTAKWKCHKCGEGVLQLFVVTQYDGSKRYFRACSSKCGHRTPLKPYTMDVEKNSIRGE
jgi:hypothetical protein